MGHGLEVCEAKRGFYRFARFPCGSELARDGGISVDICIECQVAIASRLAPTMGSRCRFRPVRLPWHKPVPAAR
ncbi:hypothetical protein DLD99_22115 [Pseudomonas kribbensis]|uniref:Uncharacterized protein n=1 Tax=Pseudomonas kribbensis TaxID=1628086 RepID=A0A345RUT9_9PSED|nr:hypothetical protein DLD99_22115 [Pseudomonas kribbensis]